ncbi:MAG: hypothetical protein AABY18_08660 [Candidatus Thermoplasmatota archaeon]
MASGSQVSSVVFGGLFIGIWLYIALFDLPAEMDSNNDFSFGAWVTWGVIGLIIAGAIYGTRIATGAVRVTLYATIGIAVGMLITAFILQDLEEGIATIVTGVGGGLIVSALPTVLREQNEIAAARYQ